MASEVMILHRLSGALVVAAALAACEGDPPEPQALGTSDDLDAFVVRAQPVLARDCAYPACHGAVHSGLRLYALGRTRLVGDEPTLQELLFEPLTIDEATANLEAVLPFVSPEDPAGSELLRRGLPAAEGGRGHGGGVLFPSRDDADYLSLLGWIEDEVRQVAP